MMILKIAQNGEMDGDCDYISDTPVTADLVPMTSGQGVTPIETPITETLTSLSVSVTNSTPASEFLCRELVDELVSISLCPGETVTLGGQVYSESDTVVIILTNSIGCDSTITYVLTLRPPPAEVFNDIGLCANEAFTFEGVDYYAPGEVIDTLTSVSGCDSLIHYGLILLPPPAEVFNDIGLCENEAFTFGGVDYYAPGEVIDTLTSVSGCDSLVHYGLILLPPPAEVFNDIGLCPNEAFTFEGVDYYAPGEVVDTLSSVFGCDSIVHYGLILFPQPTQAITISFCPGTGVLIGGQTYSQSGTVIDTIPGLTGCDTIVTYTLVKLEYPTRSQTIEFCPGETILIGGQPYTQPGIVVDTIPATAGCDTIATYTLVSLTPAPSVVSIQCPTNVSLIAEPGTAPLVINYNLPTATSDCPCPGVALTLTAGLPSGGAFPNGISQVCYTAKDSCGHSASCCFNVTVREVQPCDVKVNGCMRYELLSITADVDHNLTYRIRVINNCPNKLIYTAIQLPDGEVAMEPDHLSVFTSEGGRDYDVRNPNFSPFYSIRFKSTTDSISGGQSDIFKYTLPAQLAPAYMDITSRLAPQIFIEAHLNTFYCPIGITAPKNRNDVTDAEREDGELLLFPNPTDGTLWVDLATWSAVSQEWRIFNSQGQQLLKGNTATDEALLRIELPQGVPNGLFFFEIIDIDGAKKTARFVLQR